MHSTTSTAIENPMVAGLGRHHARQDRRDALCAGAYATLRDELIDALLHDPARVVQTPGFGRQQTTAADVIADSFAARSGEQSLRELLRIVGLCAQTAADNELRLRASAWIAQRAAEHAEFHQSDLVTELENDE